LKQSRHTFGIAEFASCVPNRFGSCAAALWLVALLLAPSAVQATETRNFVAVIVDGSKSMSFAEGRVGSDPGGLAAFAAAQLSRFVPDGTTLGVFTFASAYGDMAGPQHAVGLSPLASMT
jgi:hypothetical protein